MKTVRLDVIESYEKNQKVFLGGRALNHENSNLSIGQTSVMYLIVNYRDNGLNLKKMARDINVSSSHLTKVIKDETGLNFTDQLTKLRMSLAIDLLLDQNNNDTINDINLSVGYSSQHYFSRQTKNYTGLSPNQ